VDIPHSVPHALIVNNDLTLYHFSFEMRVESSKDTQSILLEVFATERSFDL